MPRYARNGAFFYFRFGIIPMCLLITPRITSSAPPPLYLLTSAGYSKGYFKLLFWPIMVLLKRGLAVVEKPMLKVQIAVQLSRA